MTLEGLGVNEPPSSAGSSVAKSLEGARILGTNRVLQGAAKKRMSLGVVGTMVHSVQRGETGDVEVRGGGFIDFLPRGPVTHFVGPSLGVATPDGEGLDAPQDAPSPRKIVDRLFDRSNRVFAAMAALNPLVSTQDFVGTLRKIFCDISWKALCYYNSRTYVFKAHFLILNLTTLS